MLLLPVLCFACHATRRAADTAVAVYRATIADAMVQ